MAYSNLLVLVTDPLVPLTKHTASARVRTVAPARLPVAWNISSVMGMFVAVLNTVSGSVMQNRMTSMKARPLMIRLAESRPDLHVHAYGTHVTPPTATA